MTATSLLLLLGAFGISLLVRLLPTNNNNTVVMAIVIPDQERRAEFVARNYSWPIPNGGMVPNTVGWDRIMRRRIRQVEFLPSNPKTEKYDAFVVAMESALVVPNFTQYGWAVTKAPIDLTQEIQEYLRDNFSLAHPEGDDRAIVGDYPTVMVDLPPDLTHKALQRLLPYTESFAGGVALQPQAGYGLRLYANTSQLYMHLDKIATHVISCIYHIDHSADAKPWPLVIEDFEGVTQKVVLQTGDILFYESAKCLHGRPIPFDGSWFTSLFLHYSPIDWPLQEWEAQYAIPDHWESEATSTTTTTSSSSSDDYNNDQNLPRLQMADTAMLEPDCLHGWCALTDGSSSMWWEGETKAGVAISSHGSETILQLERTSSSSAENEL